MTMPDATRDNLTRAWCWPAIVWLLLVALAGCGEPKPIVMKITPHGLMRDRSTDGYIPPWDTSAYKGYVPSPGLQNLGPEIVKHDPLLKGLPDPYQDPYLGPSTDKPDELAKDPVLDMNDPLVNHERPKNWYWVRGRISGGEVAITVNDRSIGRYSVHVDHEITDNLRPGYNTISFTPMPDSKTVPVRARIEIVYSQQSPGEAPVLIYDTERLNAADALLAPTHAPQIGGPGFDADPNESMNSARDLGPHVVTMQLIAR
jgi:hypothetical protein